MFSDSATEFALFAYPGRRSFAYPTTLTASALEISWTNAKGSWRNKSGFEGPKTTVYRGL